MSDSNYVPLVDDEDLPQPTQQPDIEEQEAQIIDPTYPEVPQSPYDPQDNAIPPFVDPGVEQDQENVHSPAPSAPIMGSYTDSNNINQPLVTATKSETNQFQFYDMKYQNIHVADWQNMQFEESEHSRFWSSPEVLQPHILSENIKGIPKTTHALWAIAFLTNIIIVIICFSIACSRGRPGYIYFPQNDTGIGYSFLMVFLGLVIHFCMFFILPAIFVNYGIFIALGINLGATIIALCLRLWSSIAYFLISLILGGVYYFYSQKGSNFTIALISFMIQKHFHRPLNIVFLVIHFAFTISISLIFMYMINYAVLCGWNFVFHIYAMYSFFWIICTIGQSVYMTAAHVSFVEFFLVDAPQESQNLVFEAMLRAFTYNFPIACYTGFLLPIVEPFRRIALYDTTDTAIRLTRLGEKTANVALKFLNGLRGFCVAIVTQFDKYFEYPTRYGMIYSAVFGVPYEEGTRRYAEKSCKTYLHLLTQRCDVDIIYQFRCLNAAIICAFMTYASQSYHYRGNSAHISYIGGACGFFLAFALFNMIRRHFLGAIEAIIIAYSEDTKRMDVVSTELSHTISNEFQVVIQEKKNASSVSLLNADDLLHSSPV